MKKILICFTFLILLSSCSERTQSISITEFSDSINKTYGIEIVKADDILVSEKDSIAYWFPEKNKNCCVSFYLNNETTAIEKCSVSIENQKINEELYNNIKSVLVSSDKYFKESRYETEKYALISFYDTRYIEKSTSHTLKKYIKEQDLY